MKRHLHHWMAQSMVALAVFGLLGCTKSGTEAPTTATDASITDALKASLSSDAQLKGERVEVAVNNGEVTLSGEVSSDAAHLQAYKLANEVPGVKKVNDLLQVRPAAASAQPVEPPVAATSQAPYSASKPKAKSPAAPSVEAPRASTAPPLDRSASTPPSTVPAPIAPPRVVTVPAGTPVRIQMIDSVDSATNKVGETFLASLAAPIVVNNEVIIPKDTDVYVKLANAKTSGKFTGQSELTLELDNLKHQGTTYQVSSTTYQQVGASRGKDTAKKTAIGAAIGTAIGAIAGGGKGAAIGAGVGAGSGAAAQVFMKGKQVKVPAETKIDFQLEQPLEVTVSALSKNRLKSR
ncbi:MAG: BON domain-containing protein [Acidobacteria bacterium]|nr:BON domain-containing protein [Acidobacteriota bacterium]MCI0717662.1 BON domain-containing protein [Acidobacteriota bacterium]